MKRKNKKVLVIASMVAMILVAVAGTNVINFQIILPFGWTVETRGLYINCSHMPAPPYKTTRIERGSPFIFEREEYIACISDNKEYSRNNLAYILNKVIFLITGIGLIAGIALAVIITIKDSALTK